MNQSSKLLITVEAENAKTDLKTLSTALKNTTKDGDSLVSSLTKIKNVKVPGADTSNGINRIASATEKLAVASRSLNSAGDISMHLNKASTAIKVLADASKTLGATPPGAKGISSMATALNRLSAATNKMSTKPEGLNQIKAIADKMNAAQAAMGNAHSTSVNLAGSMGKVNTEFTKAATNIGKAKTAISNFNTEAGKANTTAGKLSGTINTVNERFKVNATRLTDVRNRTQGFGAVTTAVITQLNGMDVTLRRLGTVLDRHNRALAAAAQGQARLSSSAAAARTNTDALGFSLSRLHGLLVGGVWAIFGLSVAKTADAMQNLDSQIKLVTNSEGQYLEVRERVRAIADKNYTDIEATTNLYQKSARALANLGMSQNQTIEFTDAVSLAMRTGGRSANEQASAILQLGQAMGAGALMGDEFRSISENAPILLDLVAKRMGVLPGQLKALASEGKITAEIMADAFINNKDLLEQMASKMPVTMAQGFNIARNAIKEAVGDMMNSTGGASEKIATSLRWVGENLDTVAKAAAIAAGVLLVNFVAGAGAATTAMAALNFVMLANPFTLAAAGLAAILVAMYGVDDVFDTSTILIKDLYGEIKEYAAIAIDEFNRLSKVVAEEWEATTDIIEKKLIDLGLTIKTTNEENQKSFLKYFEGTQKGFAGWVEGVTYQLNTVNSVVVTLWDTILGYLKLIGTSSEIVTTALGNVARAAGRTIGLDFEYKKLPDFEKDLLKPTFFKQEAAGRELISDYYRKLVNGRDEETNAIKRGNKILKDRVTMHTLLSKGTGIGVYAKTPAGLPDYLKADPNNMNAAMDETKAAQKKQLDATNALAAALKEQEKAAKEAAKAGRAANAAESAAKKITAAGRLVGVSGDTGVGKAHLHIQKRDKSAPTKAQVNRFSVNGKSPYDFGVTSGYGYRGDIGVKGASENHRGVDFGVGLGGKVTTTVPTKDVKVWYDPKGGGWVSTVTFADGLQMDLLHLDANTKKYVKSGASSGDKQLDALAQKFDSAEVKALRDRQKEAEKAAKEVEKAADDARKAAEELQGKREALAREYEPAGVKFGMDNLDRLGAIQEGQLPDDVAKMYAEASAARYDRELAVYEKSLADRIDAYSEYLLTESELLAKQRDDEIFNVINDPELSRPENAMRLKLATERIDAQYAYKLERHNFTLDKELATLYDFQMTERELMVKNHYWAVKEASLADDEISKQRAEAMVARNANEIANADIVAALRLLQLEENFLSQTEFLTKTHELEMALLARSTEAHEVKNAIQKQATDELAKSVAEVTRKAQTALAEQNDRLNGGFTDEAGKLSLEDKLKAEQEIVDNAQKEGLLSKEEHTQRMLELDEEQARASRDITIASYQDKVAMVADSFKAIFGEQSKAYRIMFAVEKGFSIARSIMAIRTGIAQAAALPYPANLGAMASVASLTASIVSDIQSVRQPSLAGQAHDGLANVPREGTYLLDAGERVVKPADNQKLTKFLDGADRSGNNKGASDVKLVVNNYSSAEVSTSRNADGDIELRITNAINKQVPAQLANPSSPIGKSLSNNWQTTPRR